MKFLYLNLYKKFLWISVNARFYPSEQKLTDRIQCGQWAKLLTYNNHKQTSQIGITKKIAKVHSESNLKQKYFQSKYSKPSERKEIKV